MFGTHFYKKNVLPMQAGREKMFAVFIYHRPIHL